MRRPGVEPGSQAWEARIITVRPPAHKQAINTRFKNHLLSLKR